MYCNKCGRTLPDGSRFCNHCGAAMPDPGSPMAAPPDRRDRERQYVAGSRPGYSDTLSAYSEPADEQTLFTLRPTLIFVTIWYLAAAFLVVLTAAIMGTLHQYISTEAAVIVILAVAALAFILPVYKHIQRRREVYTLTNHKLEMRYGLISKTVRNIPLRNIQDVTVTASVAQRLGRLGDIVIDSASESGKIRLHEVHHPEKYADMILGVLRRRY